MGINRLLVRKTKTDHSFLTILVGIVRMAGRAGSRRWPAHPVRPNFSAWLLMLSGKQTGVSDLIKAPDEKAYPVVPGFADMKLVPAA